MACSLLTIVPSRKVSSEKLMEFARVAGLGFIRLRHIRRIADFPFSVRSFQSAKIIMTKANNGGLSYDYKLSKDENGADCSGLMPLVFEPDPTTNILYADLIDTPFNRKKLVVNYYNNAQWEIVDPKVEEEIKNLADEHEKTLDQKPTKDEEIDRLRKQIEELTSKNTKKEEAPVSEELKVEKDSTVQIDVKKVKEEVKKEIYEEKADLINSLKEKKKQGWAFTSEYKNEILPLIDERVKQRLEEVNA